MGQRKYDRTGASGHVRRLGKFYLGINFILSWDEQHSLADFDHNVFDLTDATFDNGSDMQRDAPSVGNGEIARDLDCTLYVKSATSKRQH